VAVEPLAAQRDKDQEEPDEDDLFRIGTVAVVMRMLKLPDGRIRVLVQGVSRARITSVTATRPHLKGQIERLRDDEYDPTSIEKEALARAVKQLLERAASLGKNLPSEVMAIVGSLEDPGRLADLSASNLDLKVDEAQEILETLDPLKRLKRTHDFLKREIELLPASVKVITFELGLRFLADHLRGDTYFRTSYPGHNLHRARVQFRLLETIEKNEQEMTSFFALDTRR